IKKGRTYFFGGYQKTDAYTAYVPTAQSLVVVPEALAFMPNRSPQGVRIGFALATRRNNSRFANPACVSTARIPNGSVSTTLDSFCIDPFGPGFKLFTLQNPITGDYVLPTLTPGRYQRILVDPNNSIYRPGELANLDPNNLPLIDFARGKRHRRR